MTDNVISTDQGTGRVAPARQTGFYYNWGPQAWIDMWMSNSMLVKKAMPIISHTFVPILRLSGDKEQVDRDYADVKSRREILKWSDSPREKWRLRLNRMEYSPSTEFRFPSAESLHVFPPSELFMERFG